MRREKLYPGRFANTWLAGELDRAMLGAETIDEVRANLRAGGWSDEDIEACELDELFRYDAGALGVARAEEGER